MNCKKFQEWIITDYIDGQMEKGREEILEEHLKTCANCREFVHTARKAVIEPFKGAERQRTPESVWQNVRAAVEQGQPEAESPLTGFLEGLRSFLPHPRLAFATASVMAVLLMVVMTSRVNGPGNGLKTAAVESSAETEYLAYLSPSSEAFSDDQNGGYGTGFEEYFL